MRNLFPAMLEPQTSKHLSQHFFRPEVFLGDRPGGTAMPFVVGMYGIESRQNLFHGVERKQALPGVKYPPRACVLGDRKSTRLNSSHLVISYAVFCLKKKKNVATYSA